MISTELAALVDCVTIEDDKLAALDDCVTIGDDFADWVALTKLATFEDCVTTETPVNWVILAELTHQDGQHLV